MGYFRQKLRRSACAAEKRMREQSRLPDALKGWLLASARPPAGKAIRFIRLATMRTDADSHRPTGVFVAAYELCADIELSEAERTALRRALAWFERNLPVPTKVHERTIFWFKADAHDCIRRIWELVHQLREHGIDVRMQTATQVGKVEYEDQWQVGAWPWR